MDLKHDYPLVQQAAEGEGPQARRWLDWVRLKLGRYLCPHRGTPYATCAFEHPWAEVTETLNERAGRHEQPGEQRRDRQWRNSARSTASLKAEIGKVVIGQDQVVEKVLIAILSRGHACWWVCPAWRKRCW
jgi:hypothetical protein